WALALWRGVPDGGSGESPGDQETDEGKSGPSSRASSGRHLAGRVALARSRVERPAGEVPGPGRAVRPGGEEPEGSSPCPWLPGGNIIQPPCAGADAAGAAAVAARGYSFRW